MEEVMKTLEWAKKSGRARFTGISSHDRPHIKKRIETYPDQLDVIFTPYTARTQGGRGRERALGGHEEARRGLVRHQAVCQQFALQGDSAGSPHAEEDNRIARLAIRYILCNPAITAPIPGMITRGTRSTTSAWR